MRNKIIFTIATLAVPFFVFAQDGSAGLAPAASQPRAATSSAITPRLINSPPRAGTATPRPVVSQPIQATSAPAAATNEPAPESAQASNSNIFGFAALALAVLAAGGYVVYKLKTKKSKNKDSNRCFDLKKMMEDKLEEVADLKGQIESKAKEKAREKVRESLEGTSAGEVLAKIERAEKEYARLKQLYEKCVIEFEKKKVTIIAEVKTQSPFGFKSKTSWDELFEIANKIGDIISIHTDPRWGGSFDLISKAKKLTSKPILAKGMHKTDEEIQEALDMGADYVLVVGRIPQANIEKCMIEPISLAELKKIPKNLKVIWNARDLSTGKPKAETFKEARKIFKGWLCQASFIKTVSDIEEGADAVLIGSNLIEFAKSLFGN